MNKKFLNLELAYLELIEPENLVKRMSYEEFVEWAELGTKEDLQFAICEFEKAGLHDHVKIMEIVMRKK